MIVSILPVARLQRMEQPNHDPGSDPGSQYDLHGGTGRARRACGMQIPTGEFTVRYILCAYFARLIPMQGM